MNILVTAGNTQTPIDKVRCLTNIFTGRTGAAIALEAWRRGHRVRLLTSHPEAAAELASGESLDDRWSVEIYRTFDDLHRPLERRVRENPDAILHAAAVSDYLAAGIYAPQATFDPASGEYSGRFVDRAAGKVKSDEPELWLRLTRAPKLVDLFREPWGFTGMLVKFKLEVGTSDDELLAIAERSRVHSRADVMVANTLEGSAQWAYVGPPYERVPRRQLARRVIERIGG